MERDQQRSRRIEPIPIRFFDRPLIRAKPTLIESKLLERIRTEGSRIFLTYNYIIIMKQRKNPVNDLVEPGVVALVDRSQRLFRPDDFFDEAVGVGGTLL